MNIKIDVSKYSDPEEMAKIEEFLNAHQPTAETERALQEALGKDEVMAVMCPDGHVEIIGE